MPTRHLSSASRPQQLHAVRNWILLPSTRFIRAGYMRSGHGLLSTWAELPRFFVPTRPLLPPWNCHSRSNVTDALENPIGMPGEYVVLTRYRNQCVHPWKPLDATALYHWFCMLPRLRQPSGQWAMPQWVLLVRFNSPTSRPPPHITIP